ncbi:MAG: hypothetical protein MUF13_12010 [Akkermansiaceae bacterium]|nr:hypothetical protein [Akkermansiaceae bacterium]
MVLKSKALARGLKASREVTFSISGDTMPQNVILHASANVDRVDLHKSQMIQRSFDICETGIKTGGKAHEAPGCL